MTSPGGARSPTALDLLFGPEAAAPEALAREILSVGGDQALGLGSLSAATRAAAVQEAATVAAGLLQVDLIGVLVAGWREHRDIVSAARRTLAAPEAPNWSAWSRTRSQWPSSPPSACWWTVAGWPLCNWTCPSSSTSGHCWPGSAAAAWSPSTRVAATSPSLWPSRAPTGYQASPLRIARRRHGRAGHQAPARRRVPGRCARGKRASLRPD